MTLTQRIAAYAARDILAMLVADPEADPERNECLRIITEQAKAAGAPDHVHAVEDYMDEIADDMIAHAKYGAPTLADVMRSVIAQIE